MEENLVLRETLEFARSSSPDTVVIQQNQTGFSPVPIAMTGSAELIHSSLPIARGNPLSSAISPSNPDGYSPGVAVSVKTLDRPSPTSSIRTLVDQSLALSSPEQDNQPSHPETLDQPENPNTTEENSLIFSCPNREHGNYTNKVMISTSNDEEDDSPKLLSASPRMGCRQLRRSMQFRDGDSNNDLGLDDNKPSWRLRCPSWQVPEEEPKKIQTTGVGAGLWNLGNTCFINSVLQCFTHTVPLVQSLHSYNQPMPCNCGSEGFCFIRSLRDHIELALSSSGDALSPSNFVDNLNYFSSYFQRYHQEDAHEFLQSFLDKLERCCLDPKKKMENHSSQNVNIVEQVFGGRLISRLRCCNCDSSSNTYEALVGLSLEIEDVDNLQSALESFTRVEKLEEELTCDNCIEKVSKEKQLMLDRAPLVATFHLKRFKNDGNSVEKIYKHVEFPLELDLQPFTISSQNDNEVRLKYNLYAFVEHIGASLTSGHYFSYVRSSPNTWHKLDDSKVTRVQEDSVLLQNAYVLFYAREGTPWFSSVFEQIKQCPEANTLNSSPKSVLDTAYGDCISDNSTENIGNLQSHESCNIVEVPITDFEANGSTVPTDGISGVYCDEPKHDDVPMTDGDASEPLNANDLEKLRTYPRGETNLSEPVDRHMKASVCVPLGLHSPDRYSRRHQEGSFQIPRGDLKVEKQVATCKRPSNNSRVSEPLDRGIALRYLKKRSFSSSRTMLLSAAMVSSPNGSPIKRKQRMGKISPSKRKSGTQLHRQQ